MQSEPVRPIPVGLAKRDSLSDSGAEGSGANTPTRGRTYTEGLLRFVQDSSLQQKPGGPAAVAAAAAVDPQRRVSNIEAPSSAGLVMAQPAAAHVPVIQPTQLAAAINQSASFAGVIQHSHIHEAAYPTPPDINTRSGSVSSLPGHAYTIHANQPVSIQQVSRSMFVDPNTYSPYMTVGASPAFPTENTAFRPQNSTSPPTRQEARPAASLQPPIPGGETHTLRQPIMSSVAQPSLGYNSLPGVMPMASHGMFMSSAGQAMYMPTARYQNPLVTPVSPPAAAIDPRLNLGMVPHPSQLVNLSHHGVAVVSAAAGLSGAAAPYRPLPGYPNLSGMNLGHGSVLIPEPSRSVLHHVPDNSGLAAAQPAAAAVHYPTQGLINPALINSGAASVSLNPASSGVLSHTSGVLNPVINSSLAGGAYHHHPLNLGLEGASYPPMPQQPPPAGLVNQPPQQLVHPLNVPLNVQQSQQGQPQQQPPQVIHNPTPGSSIAGSMSGSYHESVHLEDPVIAAANLDLDSAAASRQQQQQS